MNKCPICGNRAIWQDGRVVCKVCHYHSLTDAERANPPERVRCPYCRMSIGAQEDDPSYYCANCDCSFDLDELEAVEAAIDNLEL